jgi:hypothetical protein
MCVTVRLDNGPEVLTATGTRELVVVLLPNCPLPLYPQQ